MHSKSYPECRPRRSPILGRPAVSAACALPRRRRAAGPHASRFCPAHAVAAGERLADQDEQARTDKCEVANTSCGKGRTGDVRPLKSSAETRSPRHGGRIFTRGPAAFSYDPHASWDIRASRSPPPGSLVKREDRPVPSRSTGRWSEDRKKERGHNHVDGPGGRGARVSHGQTIPAFRGRRLRPGRAGGLPGAP